MKNQSMNQSHYKKGSIAKQMTREEAMEIMNKLPLCNECDSSNFPYTCVECGDAFLLAMEALKQPEVILCNDCKWYMDENKPSNLPCRITEKTSDWFCADGERKEGR